MTPYFTMPEGKTAAFFEVKCVRDISILVIVSTDKSIYVVDLSKWQEREDSIFKTDVLDNSVRRILLVEK